MGRAASATLIAALAVGLFAGPLVAGPQPPDQVHRIGYLSIASRGPFDQVFEHALGERGWVAGRNLSIAYRFAEEKYERLEAEVIVAVPTVGCRWSSPPSSSWRSM